MVHVTSNLGIFQLEHYVFEYCLQIIPNENVNLRVNTETGESAQKVLT